MQFISAALGVECSFCHVQGKMELDDKQPKKTAREMMAMTSALNKSAFGGRQQVTCYSCHHGSTRVANVPPVLVSDVRTTPEAKPPSGAGGESPSADEIASKYLAAVGGADAIRKVTSRLQKGTILAGGKESPIEVITKA